MSTLTVLKDYLLGKDDDIGYLLNPEHNSKTVMLSGAWGSGKTHFWQNDIEPKLRTDVKEKACAYISLYGMDSLKEIKEEVFFKASKENDYLSEEIEVFGFDALSTIADNGGEISKGLKTIFDLNKYRRSSKGKNKLKDGGIICFDDFERKSKKVELNDLFGFISQLAIGLNCKVVIILNSDVFEGEEANVFKTVKEKTVNKFFYFEPSIEELFNSIYSSNKKYKELDIHRDEIFKAIKETKELNARIYIQVLDNCLEWIDKGYELDTLKPFVLSSIFFAKYHYSFYIDNLESDDKVYEIYHAFNENIELAKNIRNVFPQYASGNAMTKDDIIHSLKEDVTKKTKDSNDNEHAEVYYASGYKLVEENKYMLRDFYFYKYILKIDDEIDGELFNDINQFIKTGVLSYKEANI